jgi:SAM-dependent methyltransferase
MFMAHRSAILVFTFLFACPPAGFYTSRLWVADFSMNHFFKAGPDQVPASGFTMIANALHIMSPSVAEPVNQAEAWRLAWRKARRDSFLKLSQEASPHNWQQFYAQVSDLYLDLWSHNGQVGRRVTELLCEQKVCTPGCRVLDVGCGPGTLAVPLAHQGMLVTALDLNQAMLQTLTKQASVLGLANIDTVRASWEDYLPQPAADLVVASFFPDALSARGLCRLESLSRGRAALVLGSGPETFAFRKAVWEQVLDEPFHEGGFHLSCALGWLLASGRQPNLRHLCWPAEFDQPLEKVVRFYQAYFAIFGHEPSRTDMILRQALEPWRQGDRVRARGEVRLAVLWWPSGDYECG